jgi:hypothetical protein
MLFRFCLCISFHAFTSLLDATHAIKSADALTHAVRGVEWKHNRHTLPEHVHEVYMEYWADVALQAEC